MWPLLGPDLPQEINRDSITRICHFIDTPFDNLCITPPYHQVEQTHRPNNAHTFLQRITSCQLVIYDQQRAFRRFQSKPD